MSTKFLVTINNEHTVKWLQLEAKRTGKKVQDIFRDLVYERMMARVDADKTLASKIWGKQ